MSDTLDRVQKVVREHLVSTYGADPGKVTATTSLIEDLLFDSLDHVEVVVAIEDEFDIHIDDDKSEAIHTVGDLVKCVDELRGVMA